MVVMNPLPGLDPYTSPCISTKESLGDWEFTEYVDYSDLDEYYSTSLISFTARHPVYGTVILNDKEVLEGDSMEAITDFMTHYEFVPFST